LRRRRREIWHVENVSNRKILVITTLHTSNYRDDSWKKMSEPPPLPPEPSVAINLECK